MATFSKASSVASVSVDALDFTGLDDRCDLHDNNTDLCMFIWLGGISKHNY